MGSFWKNKRKNERTTTTNKKESEVKEEFSRAERDYYQYFHFFYRVESERWLNQFSFSLSLWFLFLKIS